MKTGCVNRAPPDTSMCPALKILPYVWMLPTCVCSSGRAKQWEGGQSSFAKLHTYPGAYCHSVFQAVCPERGSLVLSQG